MNIRDTPNSVPLPSTEALRKLEREKQEQMRIATRVATELDVPPGSTLSERTIEELRTGGVGIKGYEPVFLSPIDQARVGKAAAKRLRRGALHSGR